ncbi:Orotate phosphoribosyltransferase [Neolecta irregularis DAH-3]|uniref:orotate phosphoribosyltransferase n=1 Tax=Neolecta irregularis (strain DAH-3) TaxID=1198029 RepID=A0A1U7LUQ1_NEOID|nr:Orotate phosphoribosyltransferase [Neolecta irregularis DAH-3]|eukprot:OLL26241.1 Orotate phosphoribosyltransferase [Neolecta irregularis DAH-3]
MKPHQQTFIETSIACKILKFGSFTLKSGRRSPYFFNSGLFHSGKLLSALAESYVQTILDSGVEFDVIFGPAYKGIALAAVVAEKLYTIANRDVGYCYNRKEAKDHGEGGSIVGASMNGRRVLIIDDVITAGTAIKEAIEIIDAAGGKLVEIVIALDRQERGSEGEQSAIRKLKSEFRVPIQSIASLGDIIEYGRVAMSKEQVELLLAYREAYGAQ